MTRLGILLAMTLPSLANASPAAAADVHRTHRSHGGHVHITCTTLPASRGRRRDIRAAGCVAGAKKRERSRTTESRRIEETQVAKAESNVAAARAATLARVLATACQNVQMMPEPANIALARSAVLCLINRLRAQRGETPLTQNAPLEQAAESHAQEMVSLDYFDHVSPSGLTPVGRVRAAGYIPSPSVGYVIGENLAWGTLSLATPEAIVDAWAASPGHLANILESQYRDTGVGVVAQAPGMLANGAPGATYAQEFAVIVH